MKVTKDADGDYVVAIDLFKVTRQEDHRGAYWQVTGLLPPAHNALTSDAADEVIEGEGGWRIPPASVGFTTRADAYLFVEAIEKNVLGKWAS